MGISLHDMVKSDPLEVVRSSIFSVFDKKIIQFLLIRVQHFTSNPENQKFLPNHNLVATSSQE